MDKIAAMIVEDSPVARELLMNTLNSDRRLSVVAAVETGEQALRLVSSLAVDVISMDIRLPGIDGIETTRRIMETFPTPIIVVAADLSRETVNNSMEALRAGALTVVEKPRIESVESYRQMARRICDQFVNLSRVKVVRQRFNGAAPRPRPTNRPPAPLLRPGVRPAFDVVGIVASTGGPPAVAILLQRLPADFPAPILLVQHMGEGFLGGYAAWLASVCDFRVVVASDGEHPLPGTVYVAPGGVHMTWRNGTIRLAPSESTRGHIPSGDMLFYSLAAFAGPRALGILLTGMGEDGARGLLEMRHSGATTIAQDKETSAVYGMPAAAKALGAVTEELAIGAMPYRVARLALGRQETAEC
ncbi:MAG: chemotaxis-specific protein-glutamate methyltransferase CheB [Cucumibacter sp.]